MVCNQPIWNQRENGIIQLIKSNYGCINIFDILMWYLNGKLGTIPTFITHVQLLFNHPITIKCILK